jgi:putative ABC transport system substrate-binding protein
MQICLLRRREFIAFLGGTATWPLVARTQQPNKAWRIGALMGGESSPANMAWNAAFEQRLQNLGWQPDRNIQIDYRWRGNDLPRLRAGADELLAMRPDVLLASGTPALAMLHEKTRSLPIVFVLVSDPVKLGFVTSLARPGGNITGFANFEHPIGGKWLDLLRDSAPGRTRVAVVLRPDNSSQISYWDTIATAAPSFGVELTRAEVRDATDIEHAITTFAQQPNGALIVLPNAVTIPHSDLVIDLAARHRLPAVYPYRFFVTSGGLVSYGIDVDEIHRQAASYVDRILNGSQAHDLPVQLASKFELVVNLKTAKTLGLTIPESFLQHADEVIE